MRVEICFMFRLLKQYSLAPDIPIELSNCPNIVEAINY